MKSATSIQLNKICEGVQSFSMLANKHPGGSLSSAEAVTALFYGGIANFDPRLGSKRDYFVQSKGHAASPLMFTLWAQGLLGTSLEAALKYGEQGNAMPRMPQRNTDFGVELGTGALGQGLSFGLGLAIALRKRGIDRSVYVLLGDGESTEGQIWEAAMSAQRLKMRNLVALLDANGSGSLIKIPRDEWAARWEGFGWHTQVVDGHDIEAVLEALRATSKTDKPSVIILKTVKGKGIGKPLEGSNQLSSSIPDEAIPESATDDAIYKARDIVKELLGEAEAINGVADPTVTPSAMSELLRSSEVGTTEVVKKIGGSIAADLSNLPLLFVSTDAIRNSGLMEHMDEVGGWSWDNASSDVLELAIAEQDAISICAGITAGGVTGLYFSMEGFYWRGLDQIRQSVLFPQIPAVLVGTSGGVGDLLGPMVDSDRLFSVLQQMIGLDILEAADSNQARSFFAEALGDPKPTYIRLPHEALPVLADIKAYAGRDTSTGYWVHADADTPDVVFVAAGAMLPVVIKAAQHVAASSGLQCRVVEIYSVSRFAKLNQVERLKVLPETVRQISVHNAPSSVLGQFLTCDDNLSLGVDDWGKAGEDLQLLYKAYGLDAENVAKLAIDPIQ